MTTNAQGVLVIYTGGTIGSLPEDPLDPLSPLVPKKLDEAARQLISGSSTHSLTVVSLAGPLRWAKANIVLVTSAS